MRFLKGFEIAVAVLAATDASACRLFENNRWVMLPSPPPELRRLADYKDLAIFKAYVIQVPARRSGFTYSARIRIDDVLRGDLHAGTYILRSPNSSCDSPIRAGDSGYVAGVLQDDGAIEGISFSSAELGSSWPKR